MKLTHYLYIGLTAAVLASCATQKVEAAPSTTKTQKTKQDDKLELLNRVYENEAYQRNAVGKMTFTLNTGRNNVSVPGQLRMRRDEVIRIQLQVPFLGSEVGRLEFTPSEVLIIDRLHKQYVRASYDEVSFLQENGITFYTLQALFWNKLTLPGQQSVGYSDLAEFSIGTIADNVLPINIKNGKLSFDWKADATTGLIQKADVTYSSSEHGNSSLSWTYSNFKSFGSKKFPFYQQLVVSTKATGKQKTIKATFELEGISADDSWEATTSVSDKYTQVSVEEVLSKLISL